jgi:hypothetical protein
MLPMDVALPACPAHYITIKDGKLVIVEAGIVVLWHDYGNFAANTVAEEYVFMGYINIISPFVYSFRCHSVPLPNAGLCFAEF